MCLQFNKYNMGIMFQGVRTEALRFGMMINAYNQFNILQQFGNIINPFILLKFIIRSVTINQHGQIITGCGDGIIRVFSNKENQKAS